MIQKPIYFTKPKGDNLQALLQGPIEEALQEAGTELEIHLGLMKGKGTYKLYVTWRNNLEGCTRYDKIAYAGSNSCRYDSIYQILAEINVSHMRFKEIILIPNGKDAREMPTSWEFYIR